MRIITEKKLRAFWQEVGGTERATRERVIRQWIAVVKKANWNTFPDIRTTFNHTDAYGNCLIFDLGGNKYRIIAKPAYRTKLLFIRFVMTHKEYDENKWQCDCK